MTKQLPAAIAPAETERRPNIAPAPNGHRQPNDARLPAPATGQDVSACAAVSVHLDPAGRRITVRGEIDCAAVPVLTERMALLLALEIGDSTIDLTGVSFIDAAGLGCLVRFANQHAASRAKIAVVGASPRLRRVFDLVQLGGLLEAAS